MDENTRCEEWRLNLDGLNLNMNGAVIGVFSEYEIKNTLNRKNGRWYVHIPKNCRLNELVGRTRIFRSHFVWMCENKVYRLPKGNLIHHIDHDRENDDPVNLTLMTYQAHDEYHASNEGLEATRLKRKKFEKHSEESRQKLRDIAQQRGNNDIWGGPKKEHFKKTIELMSQKSSGNNNATYRKDLNSDAIIKAYREFGSIAEVARIFDCSANAVRSRIENLATTNGWLSLKDEEIIKAVEDNFNNLTKAARSLGAPNTSFFRRVKKIKDKHAIYGS